jgi:hypothetical protein
MQLNWFLILKDALNQTSEDQEIEFHEIEIGGWNYYFGKLIMRSKLLQNFMRSKLTFCKNDQEIELALGALRELG